MNLWLDTTTTNSTFIQIQLSKNPTIKKNFHSDYTEFFFLHWEKKCHWHCSKLYMFMTCLKSHVVGRLFFIFHRIGMTAHKPIIQPIINWLDQKTVIILMTNLYDKQKIPVAGDFWWLVTDCRPTRLRQARSCYPLHDHLFRSFRGPQTQTGLCHCPVRLSQFCGHDKHLFSSILHQCMLTVRYSSMRQPNA